MGDYYTSWRERRAGVIQRTISYRDRAPTGSVSRTQCAAEREEKLERSSKLSDHQQLYSDLYAEASNGETYNAWDMGHEFLTQTLKCRRIGELPTYYSPRGQSYPHLGWSGYFPDDYWVALVPVEVAHVASLGFRAGRCWGAMSTTADVRDSMVGSIQNALWAQCPDRISGSLGQDVVDILAFGKQLDKLLTLRATGVSLYKQYSQFSAKRRREIDAIVKDLRRHPGRGLKSLSRRAGSSYLSWLFQYLPWVEDLQTLIGAATTTYIRATGRTRERKIFSLGKTVEQIREHDSNGPFQLGFISPESYSSVGAGKAPPSSTWSGPPRDAHEAACKMTASVVSVWGQNFEHGAVEPLYELNKQLGIVYPSLIWDLVPWSWLVDWFVNVGEFIDRSWMKGYGEWNCSYAYVTTKVAATYAGMSYFQTCRWPIHPSAELQVRAPSASALTGPQWGILAALGLSHRN